MWDDSTYLRKGREKKGGAERRSWVIAPNGKKKTEEKGGPRVDRLSVLIGNGGDKKERRQKNKKPYETDGACTKRKRKMEPKQTMALVRVQDMLIRAPNPP
jgi:hypothetical protein